MESVSFSHSQIESIFFPIYHEFPAFSSWELALKPDFRTQTGHSRAALSSSWTHRTMSDTSSVSIIFDRTNNAAFSRIAKGAANRFLRCGYISPGRGALMRRCVAEFGFILTLAAGFQATRRRRRIRHGGRCKPERPRGHPAASQVAPKQSMPVARPVRGVWSPVPRQPPRRTRRPSCTRRISSGPVSVWRASCCGAESDGSKLSSAWSNPFRRTHGWNHLTHAGTSIRIFWDDYSDRCGNSIARRRRELGDAPGGRRVSSKQKWPMPAPRSTASSPNRAFPGHSNRSMPNVAKNKTLRDGAKLRTGIRKPQKKHKR